MMCELCNSEKPLTRVEQSVRICFDCSIQLTTHKHGDWAYNKYGEYSGKYLVCRVCGREEILYSHVQSYEIGWVHNVCPQCYNK